MSTDNILEKLTYRKFVTENKDAVHLMCAVRFLRIGYVNCNMPPNLVTIYFRTATFQHSKLMPFLYMMQVACLFIIIFLY